MQDNQQHQQEILTFWGNNYYSVFGGICKALWITEVCWNCCCRKLLSSSSMIECCNWKKNSHLQNREAEKLHCYTTTVICNLIHHNGMINSSSHVIFARWVCLVDFKTYHHLLGYSILISIIYYTWFKVNIWFAGLILQCAKIFSINIHQAYTWVCKICLKSSPFLMNGCVGTQREIVFLWLRQNHEGHMTSGKWHAFMAGQNFSCYLALLEARHVCPCQLLLIVH